MIEWGDLRYYLAVAGAGSALAAARGLGVDQSTISRRIAVLERELRVKLFNKTRGGYELTAAGRDLLARARDVETGVAAFLRSAADHETGISGSLRLATAEGIAYGLISPILDAFHQRYPALHVTLLLEDRFLDLAKGEADVAIRAGRPTDQALFGRKLTDAAWAVYAARGYVERHGAPSVPADLDRHHIIAFEGPLSRIGASAWLAGVAPDAKITSRSNSILGALLSAKSGIGVAVLPVHLADPETELIRLVDPVDGLMGEFWVLTHPEMKNAPKVRAFTDFLAVEIKKYRPLLTGRSRKSANKLVDAADPGAS